MNLTAMVVRFKSYIAGAIALAVSLLVAYISGKSRTEHAADIAEKDKEIEQTKSTASAEVAEAKSAKETVNSVSSSSDSTVDSELQQFTRD